MKNKIIIFLIFLFVVALEISYFKLLKEEKGRTLVTDAYYGDLLAVKEDVEDGAPLDYEFYFQDDERQYSGVWFNALHAAASGGDEDIINFLIDQGMNINTQTPEGWTPLFIAARDGQADAARLLIYRGAELNTQTDLGATALLMTITQPFEDEDQRMELLAYLIRRGADPNLSDNRGFSPLYYAALSGRPAVVDFLLEYDADPTTPLMTQTLAHLETLNTPPAKKITALIKKKLAKLKK
jgi:ankyrin repeat protein